MKTVIMKGVDWGQPSIVRKDMKYSDAVLVSSFECKVGCTVFMSDAPEAPSILLTHAAEWIRGKRPVDQPVILLTAGPECDLWTLEIYGDFEEGL